MKRRWLGLLLVVAIAPPEAIRAAGPTYPFQDPERPAFDCRPPRD